MNERRTRRREEEDDDIDDAPVVKKKSKKKKKQATSNNLKIAAFAGMGLLLVLLAGVVIWAVLAASNRPPVEPVTAWEKFKTDDGEIGLEHPAGWAPGNYGKKPNREIDIKGKGGKINIKENLVGSLVADIANAGAGGRELPDHLTAVAKVHELRRSGFQEEAAVSVQTKFGKARRSAYVDGSRRGYRATILMHQSALDIYCDCRETDWEVMRPAFERMIESLGFPAW